MQAYYNSEKSMSNPYFEFKKFTIRHDKCAMKVGTDSVLLGAWAPCKGKTALDIGCGTGILSIMLACRSSMLVHAIDIDPAAVGQTLENAETTPWGNRISAETADIRHWDNGLRFDTVLSNPPFYNSQTTSPDKNRTQARNTCSLSYKELIQQAAAHLSPDGIFSVVLPAAEEMNFRGLAVEQGLHPLQSLTITTVEGKSPKRILMAYTSKDFQANEKKDTLCIHDTSGAFTKEYVRLVGAYYLKL